jgi:hypothetical protein
VTVLLIDGVGRRRVLAIPRAVDEILVAVPRVPRAWFCERDGMPIAVPVARFRRTTEPSDLPVYRWAGVVT